MISAMLLVCTLASCTDPASGATVTQGAVVNRIVIDSAIQAARNAYVPPAGFELHSDDGTPIGGHTTP